jgi:purine-nucleoside phosphorylase
MIKGTPSSWHQAISAILLQTSFQPPDLAVILGSGLGSVAQCAQSCTTVAYSEIPGLPVPSVDGHAGELIIGTIAGWNVWFFSGRYHLYEGYSASDVVAPVELAAAAGVPRLLLTNAAGVINSDFPVRTVMCITDQINLTGDNPLKGLRNSPFIDLSRIYNLNLYSKLITQSSVHGVTLNRGVLASVPGPSYETPAEVRALKILGADAVSMSTVPEAIMARYLGMDVAGLSFLSNSAAGCGSAQLNHEEVLSSGQFGASQLNKLMPVLIQQWQQL